MMMESEESPVNHTHQSCAVQRGCAEMKDFNNSLLTVIRNPPQRNIYNAHCCVEGVCLRKVSTTISSETLDTLPCVVY